MMKTEKGNLKNRSIEINKALETSPNTSIIKINIVWMGQRWCHVVTKLSHFPEYTTNLHFLNLGRDMV